MYLRYREASWETAGPDLGPASKAIGTVANIEPVPDFRPVARPPALPTINLHGVRFHAITEERCIQYVLDELDAGRGGVVVTPNLDHLYRATSDMNFRALVSEAELVVADGMPLVWASRLQGTPLPQRVAGSDLISTLSAAAARRGRSIFLLGGSEGAAEGAAKVLTAASPNLRIAGTHCPPLGFQNDPAKVDAIIDMLKAARPDIVYVGLGSPKQEFLIARIRKALPQAWWLGVGVSFSFLCGDVRRAPKWVRKLGLEWSHRLIQEPKRLFKRYLLVGIPFAARMLTRALLTRLFTIAGPAKPESRADRDDRPATRAIAHRQAPAEPALSPEQQAAARTRLTESGRPLAAFSASSSSGAMLKRLKALVLLGGSVRPAPLILGIGRSILDLPLGDEKTLLTRWLESAAEVAAAAGIDKLPVRVMLDSAGAEPLSAGARYADCLSVERDQSEYRGSGGVLGSIAKDYADDDVILVANAQQVLLDPLSSIASALAATGGDLALISHQDGTPSGVQLMTCKALRSIPDTGFVDMKEQALPAIAAKFDVRVVSRRRPTGLPVRSLGDYVLALRQLHQTADASAAASDPLAEDWSTTFGIVEAGAVVDPSARIHDSVVLAGASVEAGAVLVRSVICPGASVARDRKAVDTLVTAKARK